MRSIAFIDLAEIQYLRFTDRPVYSDDGNYVFGRLKGGFEFSVEGVLADKLLDEYLKFKKRDSVISLEHGEPEI